jgi:hypothetical protein
MDFLLSATLTSCQLPVLGIREEHTACDSQDPIEITSVYHGKWERKLLPPDALDMRTTDVHDSLDFIPSYGSSARRGLTF